MYRLLSSLQRRNIFRQALGFETYLIGVLFWSRKPANDKYIKLSKYILLSRELPNVKNPIFQGLGQRRPFNILPIWLGLLKPRSTQSKDYDQTNKTVMYIIFSKLTRLHLDCFCDIRVIFCVLVSFVTQPVLKLTPVDNQGHDKYNRQ